MISYHDRGEERGMSRRYAGMERAVEKRGGAGTRGRRISWGEARSVRRKEETRIFLGGAGEGG